MFARLGRWSYRRRWLVVGLWIAAFVIGGAIQGAAGSNTKSEFTLPDVESSEGLDLLNEHFGGAGGGQRGALVFEATEADFPGGVNNPEVQAAMEDVFAAAEDNGYEELRVSSPYTPVSGPPGAGDQPTEQFPQIAEGNELAYAELEVPDDANWEDTQKIGTELRDHVEELRGENPALENLRVEVGGGVFAEFEPPEVELLGLAFAIIILIVAFGSVLAMGLPIGVGLAGIGIGSILAALLSHLVSQPDFTQQLGMMIGLGVGIDYALFIVTRFRESRSKGSSIEQSVVTAVDTAGRAVAFAGITVVISLLGMIIMQLDFVTGLAIGAATVVAATMVASLTLLPALMGLFGHKTEVTRWRGLIGAGAAAVGLAGYALTGNAGILLGAAALVAMIVLAGLALRPLKKELKPRRQRPREETVAYRWSRWIQHHPWPAALGAAAFLVVLTLPVFGMRLGFSDEGNYAEDTDARQAYDLLADSFGPGFNGPFMLVSELPEGTDRAALADITQQLEDDPAIAEANGPRFDNEESPAAVSWQIIPEFAPQDEETTDLVKDLRSDILPAATEGTGLDVAVTGGVPISVDFTDYFAERMPIFLGAVLLLSFVLLMVVFRSVLVPLKAVIMNLLGIGSAFGLVVIGFQWGWAGPLLGIDEGPIEPFIPMMLFAIVFGLSMDYEVFLLSRVREEWDRTGDSHRSVADGLAATARVISAAALIMVFVFFAFSLGDDRVIKMFGLGLAIAVLLDATVIRMLLVPATMELLGDRNWWLPRWLDRILPRIEVEGHVEPEEPDDRGDRQDRELEPVS